jgi:hypothetical protein
MSAALDRPREERVTADSVPVGAEYRGLARAFIRRVKHVLLGMRTVAE